MSKKHGEVTVVEDAQGRKHYTLHVDPMIVGVEMQKAAPDVTPKRPTFGEFLAQLNERNES